jgi:hypothetical protein
MAYLSLAIFTAATLWKQSPHVALAAKWTLLELADDGRRGRGKSPRSRIIYVIMLQPFSHPVYWLQALGFKVRGKYSVARTQ